MVKRGCIVQCTKYNVQCVACKHFCWCLVLHFVHLCQQTSHKTPTLYLPLQIIAMRVHSFISCKFRRVGIEEKTLQRRNFVKSLWLGTYRARGPVICDSGGILVTLGCVALGSPSVRLEFVLFFCECLYQKHHDWRHEQNQELWLAGKKTRFQCSRGVSWLPGPCRSAL